ncbi:hypothetical protein X12_004525 (plasmid) [Xanthomonas arboricola]|uniref:hypothetical protein n=1 Tax=Xanthomonas arboricola TaxID=56448 RepID=UPI002B2BF7F0|nr:hypothetical protein X12_004525 [Xanthomonas arboricola]
MRRISPNDTIDAEFRVIPASRLDAWRLQLPRLQDRLGYVLAAVAAVAIVAGVLTGHMVAGFVAGLALVGVAAMLTEEHKAKGLGALAMAVVLATSGCSKEPEDLAPAHTEKTQAEVQDSIRQATRYRDPREGFKPKPLPVPGAAESTEKGNDSQ